MVFLATWLAAPLIYSLDKLAAMENQKWIFVAGVIVLPIFGLMSSVFVADSNAKREPLFYGMILYHLYITYFSSKSYYRSSMKY